MPTRTFLRTKVLSLAARVGRLARMTPKSVGIRPQDGPYAPSSAHFAAANQRLWTIDQQVQARLALLRSLWQRAPTQRVLVHMALVERELDRARRAFGLFFELFSQRGTAFAPALAAYDVVAQDCYGIIRITAPSLFRGPLLKPLCYMEHGYSPATMRRGVQLNRLLGEPNPFPVVRIPWDRDNPWQAVFLHEVAHNLQADLGIWQENRLAVVRRLFSTLRDPVITRIYARWHKEIFADLAAILLGGPAAAWGMAVFLAHPVARAMSYRPGGAHPTAYLRIYILAEMLERIGFANEARRMRQVWRTLYSPAHTGRIPPRLLATSSRLIPEVVDEIAFQPRRNLAQRALVDIIPFSVDHENAIREGARQLAAGRSCGLPPRHLVSAASYALVETDRPARQLAESVFAQLNSMRHIYTPSMARARTACVRLRVAA